LQELRKRKSNQGGYRHPDRKGQLHAAMTNECAEVPPESGDALHADYSQNNSIVSGNSAGSTRQQANNIGNEAFLRADKKTFATESLFA
jgi:hypothetical protein